MSLNRHGATVGKHVDDDSKSSYADGLLLVGKPPLSASLPNCRLYGVYRAGIDPPDNAATCPPSPPPLLEGDQFSL